MLKANIINESFDHMLRNIINESKLNEDSFSEEDQLRNALTSAVQKLMDDRIINLKSYEIAMQDAIEKVYPDYSWWEVTSTNIFMDLFEKRDPWAVIDDIMNTLIITDIDDYGHDDYVPTLTTDDMNAGQWYESLKEETEDKVELATKTKDQNLLAKLSNDPDKNVREVVAMRINNKEILNKLSGDESWLVRKEVARRGIPEILSKLVNDKNPSVREAVAIKTNDPEILAKLANDKDHNVVMAIFNNDSVTNEIIDSINNRLFSSESNESLEESKKLDEKVPNDLIRSKRSDSEGRSYSKNYFNRVDYSNKPVIDYENSNYKEVDADTILKMKKRGEDLSNVYVMKNGKHIQLDKNGSPTWQSSQNRGIRTNQSLRKTLDGADKIYIADEIALSDSQPEKYAQRYSDSDEREANLKLGAYRPGNNSYDDKEWYRDRMYQNDKKKKKAIERAKQDYEDGDISRKEMEKIIANNQPKIDKWAGKSYQAIKDVQANARNYAANKSARAKVDEYKELKHSIPQAERAVQDAKNDLDSFKSTGTSSYWNRGDYARNKGYADDYRKEIADLEKKLEYARRQLAQYEAKLTDDSYNKDLTNLEDKLAKANSDLEAKTARLKALLRKNEALRRNNKAKKLSETIDKGDIIILDPNSNLEDFNVGDILELKQDVLYCGVRDYPDYDPSVFEAKGNELYVPKGSILTLLEKTGPAGWPLFDINNIDELDFAGDPFKVKKLSANTENEALRRTSKSKRLSEANKYDFEYPYIVSYGDGSHTCESMEDVIDIVNEYSEYDAFPIFIEKCKFSDGEEWYSNWKRLDNKSDVDSFIKYAKRYHKVENESLNEDKDLSKVEGSMTNVLEKNISKINSCSTVKELVNTVKEILEKNGIDTKASQRLIKNIEKQRSLMSAFSTVYNSCLAGEGNSVI